MDRLIALALACMAAVLLVMVLKAAVIALNMTFFYGRPVLCRRIYDTYTGRPWRSAAVGVANTLVAIFFTVILLNIQPLALVGIGMATALCALHLAGRTAYYQVISKRLNDDMEAPHSPGAWLRGAIAAELSFLVPVLGQLLFLAVTMRCAGACIIALLSQPVMQEGQPSGRHPETPDSG